AQLREWVAAAKDLAAHAGVSTEANGPEVLLALKPHFDAKNSDTSDGQVDELTSKVLQLQIDVDKGTESKKALEQRISELETNIGALESNESTVASVLEGMDSLEAVPDTVPASLRPAIERLLDGLKTQR
ncbi:hypothetical protein GQ54DRAFT_241724, partial [Martensiomyces pterosporus]